METGKYYKIGENKYLEILDDFDARTKYGDSDRRVLITRKGDEEMHELITPMFYKNEDYWSLETKGATLCVNHICIDDIKQCRDLILKDIEILNLGANQIEKVKIEINKRFGDLK